MADKKNSTEHDSSPRANYYIVQFKRNRVDYYIDRNHLPLKPGDSVLVMAERGRDLGRIKSHIPEESMDSTQRKYPLEILHLAKPEEIEKLESNRERENDAKKNCKEFIVFRGLGMKLIDVEMQFDNNKMTFYFTAEQRVDFRELVKDLASIYRTRIELRQIGVRDESRKIGGLGPCGRELCCTRWLKDFNPISTQFARDQNLAVNPGKLSGPCGRLLCCLEYEQSTYDGFNRDYPNEDRIYEWSGRKFSVEKVDFFRDEITIKDIESESVETICLDDFHRKFLPKKDKSWLDSWLPKDKEPVQ